MPYERFRDPCLLLPSSCLLLVLITIAEELSHQISVLSKLHPHESSRIQSALVSLTALGMMIEADDAWYRGVGKLPMHSPFSDTALLNAGITSVQDFQYSSLQGDEVSSVQSILNKDELGPTHIADISVVVENEIEVRAALRTSSQFSPALIVAFVRRVEATFIVAFLELVWSDISSVFDSLSKVVPLSGGRLHCLCCRPSLQLPTVKPIRICASESPFHIVSMCVLWSGVLEFGSHVDRSLKSSSAAFCRFTGSVLSDRH